MAKRFTATELWEEDWFLDMPNEYKLFWYYILAACDHAGVFRVNISKFNRIIDSKKKVVQNKAITYFNNGKERVRIISENKWFIEDFFVFQYGSIFNKNNKVHESIEKIYNQANISLTSIRGLKDLKEGVKDKDKDKKGGVGENKKSAIKIVDEFAYFDDGSKQELGESQKFMVAQNSLKARDVKKGISY